MLGQQSSYSNNSEGQNKQESRDQQAADAAEAAAAAVAAVSVSNEGENANMQHLAYQHAFRQQQQQQHQQHQHQQHQQHQLQLQQSNNGPSQSSSSAPFQPTTLPPSTAGKPQHGSEEWHRQRRENHKEVERRRRESINVGIKELAELIPTTDTNKAQILQRAVEYIKRLKENENNNIEKWTLEKLLTEQAVNELSASNDKLKLELEGAYREIEQWKELARNPEKK